MNALKSWTSAQGRDSPPLIPYFYLPIILGVLVAITEPTNAPTFAMSALSALMPAAVTLHMGIFGMKIVLPPFLYLYFIRKVHSESDKTKQDFITRYVTKICFPEWSSIKRKTLDFQ